MRQYAGRNSFWAKILGDPSAGGKARAESLTPTQRSNIAKKAARARWDTRPWRESIDPDAQPAEKTTWTHIPRLASINKHIRFGV